MSTLYSRVDPTEDEPANLFEARAGVNQEHIPGRPYWRLALGLVTITLVGVFVVTQLRLAAISVAYDFDEGVYWQTLRAMGADFVLYRDIFLSQPPLFAQYAFGLYSALGETLFSARFAMVAGSLIGLAGALAMGWAIAGRTGGLVAVLALASSWTYVRSGFVLQADGPSIALHLPALAAFLWWWRTPRPLLAMLAGAAIAGSILMKLLGVTIVVPAGLIAVIALVEARSDGALFRRRLIHLALALLAGAAVTIASLVPYLADWSTFIRQTVTFHVATGRLDDSQGLGALIEDLRQMLPFGIEHAGLVLAAAVGTVVALAVRPRLAVVLLAYLVAGVALLLSNSPLAGHHLVLLVPPLVALAACVLLPWRRMPVLAATGLVVAAVIAGQVAIQRAVDHWPTRPSTISRTMVSDIAAHTQPGQFVVTDAGFTAGLADRTSPPWLADPSGVRILAGFLTPDEFCGALTPSVTAVYLGGRRLQRVPEFMDCIARSFVEVKTYSGERSLWVRKPAG